MFNVNVHQFRRLLLSLITVGILSALPSLIRAQPCGGYGDKGSVTSQGTEFLLCFMQNVKQESLLPETYQDIYLASTGDTATVTITAKAFPNWSKIITLKAGEAIPYHLSADPSVGFQVNQDALIEDCDGITQKIFRVVSTSPIACYGMNNKSLSADAFLALPKNVASTEYRVMSYYNSKQPGEETPSEFCVASFEDNNTVTIIPTAPTCKGDSANKPLTFVLNAGEGIQIQTNPFTPKSDLTGSSVRSTRAVVVYGGHARTEAPAGYFFTEADGNQRVTRDHLCEAIPPLSDWGYSFVTKNFGRESGDILRVLASVDNTVVKINGTVWGAPLMANTFRDYTFLLSNFAIGNIATVETDSNHKILVGMIAHSASDAAATGDPFLAIVPPLNQTYTDFTYFLSKDQPRYDSLKQYLIVAAEMESIDAITDNGIRIPANVFTKIPSPLNGNHFYAATTLNPRVGIHHIICPTGQAGFTILAYGWGDRISYGYTAGALLKPLQGIMPLSSPSPSVAPRWGDPAPVPVSSITVRNILTERVYFDSARISYIQNNQHNSVRLKKDIALETGTIEMAEEKTLELATTKPVEDVITGNVRIWYHSRLWTDMYSVDFPFEILPEQKAGVDGLAPVVTLLENYPNPVSGNTTVHFRIPKRAYASVKLFDALGRLVRTFSQGVINNNDQNIQVSTKGITPGEYTLELLAPELGINEHRKLIVIE